MDKLELKFIAEGAVDAINKVFSQLQHVPDVRDSLYSDELSTLVKSLEVLSKISSKCSKGVTDG